MEKGLLLLTLYWCVGFLRDVLAETVKDNEDLQSSYSDKIVYDYITPVIPLSGISVPNQPIKQYGFNGYIPSNLPLLPQPQIPKIDLNAIIDGNPLLAALLLSASLGLSPKSATSNHPELLPINPYIALLLSQYGRYVPHHGTGRGLYGYAASNNYHNNKPFGSYKIYEETK
ncbi:hypothetical protein NQ314_015892 [Rhamnusium bicolor]|uniref:Uncharacterized protein n=1 Tax=Rhamnusium bicolor TaxID=1586634 RepID=A0AAV8WYB6_9CUCU|nr:hypothetical protein NQ314_015892 [Rhamnusium bicolor]